MLYALIGFAVGMAVMGIIWVSCSNFDPCFHDWRECGRHVKAETWHQTLNGCRLEGSDYTRYMITSCYYCVKCGKQEGRRGYQGREYDKIEAGYAKNLIRANGGSVWEPPVAPKKAKDKSEAA